VESNGISKLQSLSSKITEFQSFNQSYQVSVTKIKVLEVTGLDDETYEKIACLYAKEKPKQKPPQKPELTSLLKSK
jgi:hypothetical protein